MTTRPVPPVIPAASPGRRPGKPGAGHPMPLASPPGRPDVVYGFGRIDASGRVADRATIAALGWRGGDRLTLTAEAGVMIARRDPGGMVTVPARPYIVIPAALRRRCGLRAGDHVLLAALPDEDMLAAYSFAVVDQCDAGARRGPRRGEAAMTAVNPGASRQAVVEAALVLLERMGLSPADLAAVPQDRPQVPTFAEYVPVVSAAVSAGTRRAYGSYWNRVIEHWGGRRLDEPTPSEIRQLMAYVKTHVVARRNARGGRSARGAPGGRTALPVPARGGRRADRRGGQPGAEGGQAAPLADHPPGAAGYSAGGDQPGRRDHGR